MKAMTYFEAMACGLPQVCRDDVCLTNVIENGKTDSSTVPSKDL